MAEYSAKDVAALRKATGAGMMDCKTRARGDRRRPRARHGLGCAPRASARRASSATARPPKARSTSSSTATSASSSSSTATPTSSPRAAEFTVAASPSSRSSSRRRATRDVAVAAVRGLDRRRDAHAARRASSARTSSLGRVVRFESRRPARRLPAQPERPRHHRVLVELAGVDPSERAGPRGRARDRAAHLVRGAAVPHPRRGARRRARARAGGHRGEEPQRGRARGQARGRGQGSAQRVLQGHRAARAAVGEGPEGQRSASWSRASAATPSSRGSPA